MAADIWRMQPAVIEVNAIRRLSNCHFRNRLKAEGMQEGNVQMDYYGNEQMFINSLWGGTL